MDGIITVASAPRSTTTNAFTDTKPPSGSRMNSPRGRVPAPGSPTKAIAPTTSAFFRHPFPRSPYTLASHVRTKRPVGEGVGVETSEEAEEGLAATTHDDTLPPHSTPPA